MEKKTNKMMFEEDIVFRLINDLSNAHRNLVYAEMRNPGDYSRIMYSHKGEEKQEFGYYITTYVSELYTLLRKLNCNAFLDLGCGMGHLLYYLKLLRPGLKVMGFENETKLIQSALVHNGEIKKQDILEITQEQIKDFDVMYCWQPVTGKKAEVFFQNLINVMFPGQIMVYQQAGNGVDIIKSNRDKIDKVKELKYSKAWGKDFDLHLANSPFIVFKKAE